MTDHVVVDFAVKPPSVRCQVCTATQSMKLPMKLNQMNDVLDTFSAAHAKCADKEKVR